MNADFDMNLTIVIAAIPAALLVYGVVLPKSSASFWELPGWVALIGTACLFGYRAVAKRRGNQDPDQRSEEKGGGR